MLFECLVSMYILNLLLKLKLRVQGGLRVFIVKPSAKNYSCGNDCRLKVSPGAAQHVAYLMVQAQYLKEQQRIYAALAICSGVNSILKC